MTLSALSKKIEKVENEINKHQEIISDKKKELAELKKQPDVHYSYRRSRSVERVLFQRLKQNLERKSRMKCLTIFLQLQRKVLQYHKKIIPITYSRMKRKVVLRTYSRMKRKVTLRTYSRMKRKVTLRTYDRMETEGNPENIQQDGTEGNPENIQQTY